MLIFPVWFIHAIDGKMCLNSSHQVTFCWLSAPLLMKDGARYNFSASLALVRFCGPHVVTTSGGGEGGVLSAVKDSIGTFTSVLKIAEHGNDDDEGLRTLRHLKVECILTLEALSTNASLWSAIAEHAVPAIAEYLLQNCEWNNEDVKNRSTLCAALRTVQRVIPLPSHAVAAARAGLGTSLAKVICGQREKEVAKDNSEIMSHYGRNRSLTNQVEANRKDGRNEEEEDVLRIALEVLHTLSSKSATRHSDDKGAPGLYHCGAINAACFAISSRATMKEDGVSKDTTKSFMSMEAISKLGLEILQYLLSDLDMPQLSSPPSYAEVPGGVLGGTSNGDDTRHDDEASAFVDAVAHQACFIRALCATMLLGVNFYEASDQSSPQPLPSDSINGGEENGLNTPFAFDISPLYGPSLVLYEGACAGFPSPHQASCAILFQMAALCSSLPSESSNNNFWDTFLITEDQAMVDENTRLMTAAAMCAAFLDILMDEENGVCVPRNPVQKNQYLTFSLSLVRRKLLEGIQANLSEVVASNTGIGDSSLNDAHLSVLSMMKRYHLLQNCLVLCSHSALFDQSFHIFADAVAAFPDTVIQLVLSDKDSARAILDLLVSCTDSGNFNRSVHCQQVISYAVGRASEWDILGPNIDKHDLRTKAIASLCAACLSEDEEGGPSDATEITIFDEVDVASTCMEGLVGIFTVSRTESRTPLLQMSSNEAKALSTTLGKKVSDMVLTRFMKRAEVQGTHSMNEEEGMGRHSITDAPEVKLLCTLSACSDALPALFEAGGLQALSLIATEGELSAIEAMREVRYQDDLLVCSFPGNFLILQR